MKLFSKKCGRMWKDTGIRLAQEKTFVRYFENFSPEFTFKWNRYSNSGTAITGRLIRIVHSRAAWIANVGFSLPSNSLCTWKRAPSTITRSFFCAFSPRKQRLNIDVKLVSHDSSWNELELWYSRREYPARRGGRRREEEEEGEEEEGR